MEPRSYSQRSARSKPRLQEFAEKLEAACVGTVEAGKFTKVLRSLVLANGLHYYARRSPKPRLRAALALGVRVGSVVETEEERGVAHIAEHLAFSATRQYTNHDIVKFLESVGAQFGACQNASTSGYSFRSINPSYCLRPFRFSPSSPQKCEPL
ncbi:hypothetical protein R1sor_022205 [Riccia sorocarpa]|uniref:Peptidase M16 N-terminal domain-containing protein n=1 Tax=Riccia sorocarpa TaxID=122646 RepID=A0ABD3GQ13_9MARC